MCTAATYNTNGSYFGRNLDYEFSYNESVTITPRSFPLKFRNVGIIKKHFAIIGMAYIQDGYPLYYDGCNERGVGIAGLNFVGNAYYNSQMVEGKDNIAAFELIPWLLCQSSSIKDMRRLLSNINIMDTPFSPTLPTSSLHYLASDGKETIVIEAMKDGLHIYDNKIGVLTNNPPFPIQMWNLNNYMAAGNRNPINTLDPSFSFDTYSRGMGSLGIPGDPSSASRFVKVAFTKLFSQKNEKNEESSVAQFFHILHSVEQQRGITEVKDNEFEITIYTSCCSLEKGIYYYNTYENYQIQRVDMHSEDLESRELISYPINNEPSFNSIN